MKVLFRVDSSRVIGSGHLMRCLALANGIRNILNGDIIFVCKELNGNLNEIVIERGYKLIRLNKNSEGYVHRKYSKDDDNMAQKKDAYETIKKIGNSRYDWIITDNYFLDDNWKHYLKDNTKYFFDIDDLFKKTKYSNLILNQAPKLVSESRYQGLIQKKSKLILGPKYALIDNNYIVYRKNSTSHNGKIKKILISYGGSDETDETVKAIKAINYINNDRLTINVVIGKAYLNINRLKDIIVNKQNINIYHQARNMAELIIDADLALGGGGGSTWERMCLGLPSIVTTTSDDQISVPYLHNEGLLIWIGRAKDVKICNLKKVINNTINNPADLIKLSDKCKNYIDGNGVNRTVNILNEYSG